MCLLLLFVILFAIGIGRGATKEQDTFSCSSEEQKAWMDRLFRPRPVASGEVSGCTTALGKPFVVRGTCNVVVSPADEVRRLVIYGTHLELVTTTTITDDDSIVMQSEPDAGSEVTIGKNGGRVTLNCKDVPACQAEVR